MSIPSSGLPDLTNRDKVVHAVAFFGFAFLWRKGGLSEQRTLLWGVAYAILSEVYQAIMPIGRSGDWQDTLADCVGLLLGLLLIRVLPKPSRV